METYQYVSWQNYSIWKSVSVKNIYMVWGGDSPTFPISDKLPRPPLKKIIIQLMKIC